MDDCIRKKAFLYFHPIASVIFPHFQCVDRTNWRKLITEIQTVKEFKQPRFPVQLESIPKQTPEFALACITYIESIVKKSETLETTVERPIIIGRNATSSTITARVLCHTWNIIDLCNRKQYDSAVIALKTNSVQRHHKNLEHSLFATWQYDTWYPIITYEREINIMRQMHGLCEARIDTLFTDAFERQCCSHVLSRVREIYNTAKEMDNDKWTRHIFELLLIFIVRYIHVFQCDPFGYILGCWQDTIETSVANKIASVGYYRYYNHKYARILRAELVSASSTHDGRSLYLPENDTQQKQGITALFKPFFSDQYPLHCDDCNDIFILLESCVKKGSPFSIVHPLTI